MSKLESNRIVRSELNQTTIILILKDRHSFTSRWIDYFSYSKCNYNLLIADGSKDSSYKEVFESRVPGSKYVYLGPDISTTQYLDKINYAISLVETKFIMFAANDDFISYECVPFLEDFLQGNIDYVSVIGKVFDVGLTKSNKIDVPRIMYAQPHQDQVRLEEDTPVERVFLQIRKPSAGWHSLVRTESILMSYKLVSESNVRNFELIGYLVDLIMCCYGKIKVIDSITTMLHEIHGDQEAYNLVPFSIRASDPFWIQEIQESCEILSSLIQSEAGVWINPQEIKSEFFEWEKTRQPKTSNTKIGKFFQRLYRKILFELSNIMGSKESTRIDIPVEYREEIVKIESFLAISG